MSKVINIDGTSAAPKEIVEVDNLLEVQKEMLNAINYVDDYAWRKGTIGGLDWGMESLNKAFDGLQPGLILVAGQPNIGKSAFCAQVGWKIAEANREVTADRPNKAYVMYFSLDDNMTELLPRIVALDQKVTINAVKSPRKFEEDIQAMTRRQKGINKMKEALDYYKIIDSTQGTSIEFIEEEIRRHQLQLSMKDEKYKLVVIIDNFHDITVDTVRFSDDSGKYDHIAEKISKICTQFDIPVICTAEFRKLNGNRRPTCDDVRESVKIQYEAKAIMLCYNEVGIRGEAASIYWQRTDVPLKQPVLEVKVGKNKFSSFKNRLFYEFVPEMSYLKEVPDAGIQRYNQMILG